MRSSTALAFVAAALLSFTATANDSTFGGVGAELIPLVETRIRMVSEAIVLDRDAERWRVEARYAFENPTEETIVVEMGFPERHCHSDEDCTSSRAGHFQDLQTMVRGVEVVQQTGSVDPSHDWAPSLGRVWLYTVEFAPGERIEIVHRYTYESSGSVDGEIIDYVTRTGKLWNGPIGHARFVVRTFERPWMLEFPAEFALVSLVERPGDQHRGITEIVFEMRDWTPRGDFSLLLATPFRGLEHLSAHGLDCPALHDVVAHERTRESDPKAADALAEVLERYDPETLRTCRNLPYAAHGRPFTSHRLRRVFYGSKPEVVREAGRTTRVRVGMRENPAYGRGLLTNDELIYVRALARSR